MSVSAGPQGRGVARLLADIRSKVTVCAWCGATSVGASWRGPVDERSLLDQLDGRGLLSHGICPRCFAVHVPDVAYPV